MDGRRYISRRLVSERVAQISGLAQHHAFLCGPPPMIDASQAVLLGAGIAAQAIFADRFYDRSRPAPAKQPLAR